MRTLLASLLVLGLSACGSTVDLPGSGGSGGSGSGGGAQHCAGLPHAGPPAPGPDAPATSPERTTFAVSKLFLGDTDREGKHAPDDGWKLYAFDVDHQLSGQCAGYSDLCTPLEHMPKMTLHTDAADGGDNSFGQFVVPILTALHAETSSDLDAALAAGGPTLLVDVTGLSAASSATGLAVRLYRGAPLGAAPLYDGSDAWPVRPESLLDPTDPTSAALATADGYVTGDVLVARFHGTLVLEVPWELAPRLRFTITDPVLAMTLDPARSSATMGTLAGVLALPTLLDEGRAVMEQFPMCPGSEVSKAILRELAQAADLLADGSQGAGQPCAAVSLGVGFDARRVVLGAVAAPEPPPPPPTCAIP